MSLLQIKAKNENRSDLISLGEVLLRFDPGNRQIRAARQFEIWEGGGEYNVARNLRTCFGLETAIVTALTDNEIGRLVENLIEASGVDASAIIWRQEAAGTRNGLYFIERGFGLRAPNSCFDRADTAISGLQAGEIDWQKLFSESGARWFHTGGVFCGLSPTTPVAAAEAMQIARANKVIVSYDLNYRDSLWLARGGRAAANQINRELLPHAAIVFGVPEFDSNFSRFSLEAFRLAAEKLKNELPNLQVIASTLRLVKTASRHDLSGVVWADGNVYQAKNYFDVDVLDRVGSGDAFASGLIYGLLQNREMQFAVECATAHAVLAMTTPGDNSMAILKDVLDLIEGGSAAAQR